MELPDSVILALAVTLWMISCYVQARHDAKRQRHLTGSVRAHASASGYSIQKALFRKGR